MPHNHEWQFRIKAVELEHKAMRQAADRFLKQAQDDPTILRDGLRHRNVVDASRKLEGTYLMRLFAEFETAARQYWNSRWTTHPKTFDLLAGLTATCGIPESNLDEAHLVRECRNSLVHERNEKPLPLTLLAARGHLCHFLTDSCAKK